MQHVIMDSVFPCEDDMIPMVVQSCVKNYLDLRGPKDNAKKHGRDTLPQDAQASQQDTQQNDQSSTATTAETMDKVDLHNIELKTPGKHNALMHIIIIRQMEEKYLYKQYRLIVSSVNDEIRNNISL